MIWKYYIPHVWEDERTVWEDVYLLPETLDYAGEALWLTVDALGFYEEEERLAAEKRLNGTDYWIDDADMLVRAEDFSLPELLAWVRLWLQTKGLAVVDLVEGTAAEFEGKVAEYELLQTALANAGEEGETIYIDPDTFLEIPPETETGHQYKLMMSRKIFEQIEAMSEYEAEELMRAIASLADNPLPRGAKRLPSQQNGHGENDNHTHF